MHLNTNFESEDQPDQQLLYIFQIIAIRSHLQIRVVVFFVLFFCFLFFIWLDDDILHTSTVHKTASLAVGNSACWQSSGADTIKHNPWKLALRGHLNTDAKARGRTLYFLVTRTMP